MVTGPLEIVGTCVGLVGSSDGVEVGKFEPIVGTTEGVRVGLLLGFRVEGAKEGPDEGV